MISPSRAVVSLWRAAPGGMIPAIMCGVAAGDEDMRPGEGIALNRRLAELVPGTPRSELQRTILEHDWATTPLGPEERLVPDPRTAVSFCLNSRFPILLMWGPELVMIYNDAYAPLLGERHPAALGRRAAEVWSDIWDDIGGMADEVFAGRATYSEDLPLVMSRHGYRGGDLLHLLLQPGRGAGRAGGGPGRHRRRDDEAGARHPPARRPPAAGQPAPVGARQHAGGGGRRAARAGRGAVGLPVRARLPHAGPTGRTRGSSPARASASRASCRRASSPTRCGRPSPPARPSP